MATILIVDDKAPNREFLTSLLGYKGHRVIEAADGSEALEMLRKLLVDLVVSDILMPTMDGYELVRRMRGAPETARTPVIFFTAHYNEIEAHNLARACGVSRVLTKTADPEVVLRTVEDVLTDKEPPAPAPEAEAFDEQHLRVVNRKLVDVTDELRRQSSHLAALIDMNLQLASERDPQALLSGFSKAARELVSARHVVVAVHAADRGPLRLVKVSGLGQDAAVALASALLREGAFGDQIADPRTLRAQFESGDPAAAGLPAAHPPVRSLVLAPIRSLAHVYGWVCATEKVGALEFSEQDERLLGVLAAEVGRIYENGSLYAELKKQTEGLQKEIVERKAVEAALLRSEERFRLLFQNAPLPMWVYGIESLRFLEVNDVAVATYGYSREEFAAMSLLDVRPAEEVEPLLQWMRNPPGKSATVTNWRHRYKDGRLVDVEIHLHEIEFAGVRARLALMVDVTARKEAERQTQRIFETSQDVIIVTNSFGTIRQVSPSALQTLGYHPDEMVGRSSRDFVLPDDLESVRRELRVLRKGRATKNFRCRFVHKDGRTVSLTWMAVWSEADRRFYFIGRDMTEHDRREEELRQALKMEAVGQLTGGVAHDFNNILTVIMGSVEALEDDGALRPAALERVGSIADATERAADLTRQLLAFSRKQALRPQPTDMNELVAATGKLLRRTLGEQIEIESMLADDLWRVEVDRAQLESALINLSINARDAMPDGGRLTIETRNATLDDDYVARHPGAVAGEYAMLAVTDTGKGIPANLLDKVFEPFFTTKAVGKGTGLGLSMVYGFINQSRGRIELSSDVGSGTSVRLYLPRVDGRAVDAAAEPAPEMPRGGERILVVEDDAQVRASVVGQLRSLGYEIDEAADGAAALERMAGAPRPYDLLVSDVIMPSMNGRALADEVNRRWPATKIMFMSGYTENAIVHHGRLDPGVVLLSKPFRKADLAQVVRRTLDGTA
jgi:PAS domain S-box-containing protein